MPIRSCGVWDRGMHCVAAMAARCCGVTVARSTSVKVALGRMAFTVTPSGPSSRAMERVIPITAALEVT